MLGEVRITPSILNADKSHLQEEIAKIAAVSDLLHLDIMDNLFVPNLTWDFDAAHAIIKGSPLPVDSHLMVADVDQIAVARRSHHLGIAVRRVQRVSGDEIVGRFHPPELHAR